jgi:importin subunit alpha-1
LNFAFLGTVDQIKYLVSQGCIPPLCDLLTVMDAKIVQVALSGLENILRFGDQECKETGTNPYAVQIEECYGLDKIEFLQSHDNLDIYQKSFDIIAHYFGSEEDDASLAPAVDAQGQQFEFNPALPQQQNQHGGGQQGQQQAEQASFQF